MESIGWQIIGEFLDAFTTVGGALGKAVLYCIPPICFITVAWVAFVAWRLCVLMDRVLCDLSKIQMDARLIRVELQKQRLGQAGLAREAEDLISSQRRT